MNLLKQTIMCLLVLTLITGVIYPLIVTGIAQLIFPRQAHGSLIMKDGKAVGSALIGQSFGSPEYFWPRPSATSPVPYNAASSSGSNLGPLNPVLIENIKIRVEKLKSADPQNNAAIPVDLVTASGSGLDPDISLAAAEYQVPRVARARHLNESEVRNIIAQYAKDRQFGLLGQPRMNVLELNLALDTLK